MKVLYLDIFSGISGDMFIGAMLDLGVDLQQLQDELVKLGLQQEYHLHATRKQKSTIEGVKFDVHLHDHDHAHDEHRHDHEHGHSHSHTHDLVHAHPHQHGGTVHSHEHHHQHGRNYQDIKALISRSSLSDWVKSKSLAVFHRIAVAEGKIHGQPPDQVHFHEVGAVDSIIDIVGACVCLDLLGRPRLLSAHVVDGTGWINCAHGRFPIPAPATLNILAARGVSISQTEEPNELVTTTGAAILAELVETFGPLRDFTVSKVGFGLGARDNKTRPNVLRALLGEIKTSPSPERDWQEDTVIVLETNLDDINSELLGNLVETAFAQGALDVFHTPIQMKKNRPGVMLSVLAPFGQEDALTELILRETTALGVRRYAAERRKLRRDIITVSTSWGDVEVKVGSLNNRVVQASPEYESCRKIAGEQNLPLKDVYTAALAAYYLSHPK